MGGNGGWRLAPECEGSFGKSVQRVKGSPAGAGEVRTGKKRLRFELRAFVAWMSSHLKSALPAVKRD